NLPDSAESAARLSEVGIEPDRPHAVTLVQLTGRAVDQQLSKEENRHLMGALSHGPRRAALIARPSWVVAIFPLGSRDESSTPFAHSLDRLLGETGLPQIRIGVGRLARSLSDFPKSYREAREALFIASMSGDTRTVWHFNDLGVWRLLMRVEDQTELERLARYYLSPLTNHDRDQHTSWLKTLETFLEQNGNLRAAARALELHRNTVTYQIEHIGKLLGRNLNDHEVRLNLQLALRARRLLLARKTNSQ
ncbi:MAG TPA: helix-turn-helix domain-containing protein, partial [Blastocatellia bacterium]|nr:helix-turn-helix domain-containing protein [Blastocatellia bacterium]